MPEPKKIDLSSDLKEIRDMIDGIRELRGLEPLYEKGKSEQWSFSDYYWANRDKERARKKAQRDRQKLLKASKQPD